MSEMFELGLTLLSTDARLDRSKLLGQSVTVTIPTQNALNTQRIERHNLNLRTHLKRLARRTNCFSKSEVMHDKIIGWYLTIHHYH